MYKVLIVDDESYIRDMLKTLIASKTKYEVTVATTSQDAYNLLVNQPFDVLVLDINMPIMSGIELMQKSKNLKIKPSHVIIVSALNSEETRIKLQELGVKHFAEKLTVVSTLEDQAKFIDMIKAIANDS